MRFILSECGCLIENYPVSASSLGLLYSQCWEINKHLRLQFLQLLGDVGHGFSLSRCGFELFAGRGDKSAPRECRCHH